MKQVGMNRARITRDVTPTIPCSLQAPLLREKGRQEIRTEKRLMRLGKLMGINGIRLESEGRKIWLLRISSLASVPSNGFLFATGAGNCNGSLTAAFEKVKSLETFSLLEFASTG
ncbi:hypothetical protein ACJ72_05334 [Emergomyces africanus]|uniref:Uncharacterized protein n=1 Tax=Emergomyces africanus TaxID=1955775 RepID=A0A1B7NUN9_9EURO|nr:hypothetical protein ACJ72_05334 [Emergomyces africanus]